ncbi:DUF1802 family protein [Leptolyngbya sp. FACHB-261]|uniref:DUF1802 family protein n=1 Tax=Leptolyngbya sp. FACHB-261 TaxID=2692806 RepID=UPI00168A2CA0|nr:DUF1802 family protein [Leptolyngbya sp. FACHB-261]MBD2103857.1 DUF1802 family protein [Leptolyngbya sp. FACHB-261]
MTPRSPQAQPLTLQVALKEWAVVCAALASGLQTISLRKGGIRDLRGVFSPEHSTFWLYPTFDHQKAEQLQPTYHTLLEQVVHHRPRVGQLHMDTFAVVEQIRTVSNRDWLKSTLERTIWAESYVDLRFDYKPQKPLYLLILRVYRLPTAHAVQELERYAGCISWVDLEVPLTTAGAEPVLNDLEFARCTAPFTEI